MQYFGSIGDLIQKLKVANLQAISAGMQLHSRKNLQAAAKFWRGALLGILADSWDVQASETLSSDSQLVHFGNPEHTLCGLHSYAFIRILGGCLSAA